MINAVTESVLEHLNEHASSIGTDLLLVQGAGGNLSGKDGDLVWVKASGTRLSQANERPIFIGVDGPRARSEALVNEDLRHVVIELPPGAPPRPSIETALHVLLTQRFVFHVHSVGSIAMAVRTDPAAALEVLSTTVPTRWVPYAKPGISLARAVLQAVDNTNHADELALLLGNHGLVTAAAEASRARILIDQVEAALRTGHEVEVGTDFEELAPKGSVSPSGASLLLGGVLTPDEAVFLGPQPFAVDWVDSAAAVLTGSGAVLGRSDLSADARDIVLSLIQVAAHVDPHQPVRYLEEDEIAALLGWEAEKWRQGLAR